MLQVRSNHERLVALSSESGKEKQKDSPLKLKSTAEWKQRGTAAVFSSIHKALQYVPLNYCTKHQLALLTTVDTELNEIRKMIETKAKGLEKSLLPWQI